MHKKMGCLVAAAHIRGGVSAPVLQGNAFFYPQQTGVLLTIQVAGLPAQSGFFALHIHEGESCGGTDFSESGSHYNPAALSHPCHAGDLPPLLSCGGTAFMTVLTNRFTMEEIIGKTIVIHNGTDDFQSQPAGNAGTKIACGTIKTICRC